MPLGYRYIILSTMKWKRIYFVCPKTFKQCGVTYSVHNDGVIGGPFLVRCRHCGELHHFGSKDVVKMTDTSRPPRGTEV